jgi:glycosyltransferase involved in cell wall biosynthesis
MNFNLKKKQRKLSLRVLKIIKKLSKSDLILMKVSVIISTYNSPEWLEKVLWGYECQTYKNFEVVIADDGSGEPTRSLIKKYINESSLQIIHVWHEDRGFQKSQILNKAIEASTTEYLIFSDGDCIPRKDFVEVHINHLEKEYFLSGGYFMLPMETSKAIIRENVLAGDAFDVKWLHAHGLSRTYKTLKLTSTGWKQKLLNAITPTKA